ncbi:MAG: penicillin-binding protein 2 [Deltaproteobacteria bacterium]|nr:penicillin-binding protein 2 [Deltaproteobacteria bacterium]
MLGRRHVDSPIEESRFITGSIFLVFLATMLLIRLWYLQIYRSEYYLRLSESNRIRRIEIPAPRGVIFDRKGRVILGNRPFFDLVLIPQYVNDEEKTLAIISQLLHLSITDLRRDARNSRGQPKFLPITLKRNLTIHEVAIIEAQKSFLPGVEINIAPRRDYKEDAPPHILGYVGEISPEELKARNEQEADNPYFPGELVGKHGLEAQWESLLRGRRGYKYIQVDAHGRQTRFAEDLGWKFPTKPAIPGVDLVLTLDMDLQREAINAFQGKYGAVVVMDPRNGEILAMVSSPSYNPEIYQEGISHDKWQALVNDPFKPLFDKTTGGAFAPGSVYKPVVALAALEEGIIRPEKTFPCHGVFTLGRDTFRCHNRWGHGLINLEQALVLSCDVYFYHLGVELGVDRIAKYAQALGLGKKLGVRLNKEEAGLVPTTAWRKQFYKTPFTLGDAPSLAIGQGANLLTPLQLASVYASIANGGKVWRPIIVKKASNHIGETIREHGPEQIQEVKVISAKSFRIIRHMLQAVVEDPRGTGRRVRVPGHTVAGKTGSAQVVSLKKARDRKEAMSMKWQEHALFAAFSPVENAEIVVAVVSENDPVAGGGREAAPVAQRIIKKYWESQEGSLEASGGLPREESVSNVLESR